MNNMANFFKLARDQDMTHVSAINIVNLVGSRSHIFWLHDKTNNWKDRPQTHRKH